MKWSLLPLLFTVFIDSLGFGLVFPIFSPLLLDVQGGMVGAEVSLGTRGALVGLLISSFCIAQFFSGPFLGAHSDKKGRKKILLYTVLAAFASYLMAGLAISYGLLWLLFISRIAAGISAGNYAIAQSTIVDTSQEKEMANNFGLIGMAWGLGFIIGPYIGGKLLVPSFFSSGAWTTPFWFAAFLCGVNYLLLWFGMRETLPASSQIKMSLSLGVRHLKMAFTHPTLRGLFIGMFLFSFGWGFFTEFSPIFLIRRMDFSVTDIANFYAYVGICIAVSQGVLIRPFVKKFAPHQILLFGLLTIGVALPFMLAATSFFHLLFVLPFIAFAESLIGPTATTLVSNLTPKENQGEMLGIYNSIQWAAIGLAPLFTGSFVTLYTHLPITVASGTMFIAWLVYYFVFKKIKQPEIPRV